MSDKPATVLDPVCGMTVDVAAAEARGLSVELDGRIYAFCGPGCRRAFVDEPQAYAAVEVAVPSPASHTATAEAEIDEGMRRWYEACSCCLSEAYPEIKARLDAERAAAAAPPVDAGICEVAEAAAGS